MAGRPTLIKGNTQMLFAGMGRLSENSVVNIKNKSFARHRRVWRCPPGGAEGVIIAQGGRFGGWSLYAKDGKAKFYYNVLGIKSYDDRGHRGRFLPARRRCAWSSPTTAAAWARAATSRSTATASTSARAASSRRKAFIFSADETTDIGYESGTTVSPDYTAHTSRFNGKINWVQIDLGDDAKDADHYIDPDERLRDRDGAAVGVYSPRGMR